MTSVLRERPARARAREARSLVAHFAPLGAQPRMMLVQAHGFIEQRRQLERLGVRSSFGKQREQRAERLKLSDLDRQLGQRIDPRVAEARQLHECAERRHAVVERVDETLKQIIRDRGPVVRRLELAEGVGASRFIGASAEGT